MEINCNRFDADTTATHLEKAILILLIRSDMTESSGIFTFPSTGIYGMIANEVVQWQCYSIYEIYNVTADNSTYDNVAHL
jgi:hypothetical protein